jgi:hypothetical protein
LWNWLKLYYSFEYARTPIIELGPQDNKSAQKDNITVSDTEIKGLRRSQRIRIPSNKLKGYIYN